MQIERISYLLVEDINFSLQVLLVLRYVLVQKMHITLRLFRLGCTRSYHQHTQEDRLGEASPKRLTRGGYEG